MRRIRVDRIVAALLKPLVKICLSRGVRLKECEELLRAALVQEARDTIVRSGNIVSASKISIATGIHRTEVARLLAEPDRSSKREGDLLTRVVGLWSQAKRFRGKDQKPKSLTFSGDQSEFAALVAEVSREGNHYSALFELERLGFITYAGDVIQLQVEDFTPAPEAERGLELLSEDVADLASAVEHNVAGSGVDPALHLRTAYDNLDEEDLQKLQAWVLEQGAEFHARMRAYLSKFDRDVTPKRTDRASGRSRVSVVTFAVAEPIEGPKVIKPKKRGRKPCAR